MIESDKQLSQRTFRGRWLRAAIFAVLLPMIVFFGLRWIETTITYHPHPYTPGPRWQPPKGGEDVWFAAGSGEKLHGWFFKSAMSPAAGTVLYCHGNGGNITNVGWIAATLARAGFDVLVFDYRGYGRSEGKISNEQSLYADADAAYEYLIRERGAYPERLILYGLSLGTTAAIDLGARRRCGALIVESGLSSASEMAKSVFPWLPVWLHRLGRNRFESAQKIPGALCPVLVIHGTADGTIPVSQGRALYEAAREPKRLMIIEGGDHNLAGAGGEVYLVRIVEFVRAALDGRPISGHGRLIQGSERAGSRLPSNPLATARGTVSISRGAI